MCVLSSFFQKKAIAQESWSSPGVQHPTLPSLHALRWNAAGNIWDLIGNVYHGSQLRPPESETLGSGIIVLTMLPSDSNIPQV